MHAEHRGRTNKCPIVNHRVDYSFTKLVSSVRITIDKNNNLTDCPLEFEVIQEFAHTDKITLGHVKLNLAEYVEESENLIKDIASPGRGRSGSFGVSPATAAKALERDVEDGIIRRYLMQDSKVNSTLKIGILMIQKDGDRNFSAPPLRTAAVFGGIAGFTAGEQVEDEATGRESSMSLLADAIALSLTTELQLLYRAYPSPVMQLKSKTSIVVAWPPHGTANQASFQPTNVLKTFSLEATAGAQRMTLPPHQIQMKRMKRPTPPAGLIPAHSGPVTSGD